MFLKKKIPKDLIPILKKNLICPSCLKKNISKKNKIISVYKDCSFPDYEYIKCINCNCLFISNVLSDKKLTFLHNKYYANWENFNFNFFKKIKRTEDDRKKEWKKYYKLKIPNFIKRKKYKKSLDIGCGWGGCAAAFSEIGFDSYGIDPQKQCIVNAKKKFKKTKYIYGTIDTLIKKGIHNFDIITMHDVLEHIHDPRKLIQKCKLIMSKRGKIFIKVPNSESLQIDLLKEYSWEISPPFHRTLFSKKGLNILFLNFGLKIDKYFNDLNTWGWTRGISIEQQISHKYELLRNNTNFRKLDLRLDILLENISKKINKPSILCIMGSIKK